MTVLVGGADAEMWCSVESQAVRWLAGHHSRFDPDLADDNGILFARKALIEVALFVGLRARLDPAPVDDDYQLLLDTVAAVAARPSYRELAARDPRALLLYGATYAALRLCGREDLEFRLVLEQAVAGRYATSFERIPYRYLDLLHTLELAGLDHGLPSIEETLPFTLLNADPDALRLSDGDVYAITHALFYATDFGLRVPVWPNEFDVDRMLDVLEALMLLARHRGNADLVAELICSSVCLGVRESSELARGWEFLCQSQDHGGRVDGPDGIVHPDTLHREGADQEDYESWATGYHTTIVAALAALMSRSPMTVRHTRRPTSGARARRRARLEQNLARAATFLTDHAADAPLDVAVLDVAAACQVSVGIDDRSLVEDAVARLALRADHAAHAPWDDCGADTVLAVADALRETGLTSGTLEAYLAAIGAAIGELPTLSSAWAPTVDRLTKLGHAGGDNAERLLLECDVADPGQFMTGSVAEAGSALARVCGGDARELNLFDEKWRDVAERLAAGLPIASATYQLGEMAALVRALALLGWSDHRLTGDAVAFMLNQQTAVGAFGYPACDDPTLREEAQLSWTRSCCVALATIVAAIGEQPAVDRRNACSQVVVR